MKSVALIVPLLFLQLSCAWQQCTQEGNTDFSGHDLEPGGKVVPAKTSEACCAACMASIGCSTWTLSDTSACYLKSSSVGRQQRKGYMSGCVGYPVGNCTPIPDKYRCDSQGGERGVCLLDRHGGNHTTADCDSTCGHGTVGFECHSDWDCSLAGVCQSGVCLCDGWTSGADCSYLHFLPVDPDKLGYLDPTHSSWGGNAVQATDGKWHLFMAEIACANTTRSRCGLGGWFSNSQVAHAVATNPAGPYTRVGLTLGVEHHNPTLKVSPVDGTWHLYSISSGGGPIVVHTSADQGHNWAGGPTGVVVDVDQNPGPLMFANGSVAMFYRATASLPSPSCSDESIGLHICANASSSCSGGSTPIFDHTSEDPFVWVDHRGHWHMLTNALPGACLPKLQQGGHAWSRDGRAWSEPRVGAYNTTVQLLNGSTMVCQRRERPQMLLEPQTGRPLAMTSGVTGCPAFGAVYKGGSDCFTLAQPMAGGGLS